MHPSLRSMRGLNLATIAQLNTQQTGDLVTYAAALKRRQRRPALKQRSVALLFAQPSTRTRLAIHTAITEEGGTAIDLSGGGTHWGGKESQADTVRTISQFCSAIAYRGVEHETFEQICQQATVPVINALTARYHPTQALADLLTIYEHFGRLNSISVAYLGDCRNNMARSLAIAAVQSGISLTLAAPAGYQLDRESVALCEAIAVNHKRLPRQTADPEQACAGADVIYTDVWYSMGDEAEKQQRIKALKDYAVTAARMHSAGEQAIFMHCLPANRGDEVSDAVIDSAQSLVWRQAGNRRHVFKALLRVLLR